MFPTIISFYTENTPYEEEIKGLIESCKKYNLPYSVDPLPNFGSWERNCCFKPKYILKKLIDLNGPVLWIDADGIVYQKPTLFDTLDADIAVRVIETIPDDHPSKILSGTLFFNYTPEAIQVLQEWDEETEVLLKNDPKLWDQISLRNVLLRSKANIYPLDVRYCQIYNQINDKESLEKAFIIHFQASRTLQKTLNREVVSFWDEDDFIRKKKLEILAGNIPLHL
ncbi:MAG: hypothetical protein H7A38_01525 [Chlamydiales bacterium]|nr:hypothetical protein [Chlamydiales bacterium]